MAFDENTLSDQYDLVKLSVISSSQIANRIAAIVARLAPEGAVSESAKPSVVALTAVAKVSSKLISIVEIAKRELAAKGKKCFQYNALSSKMIEMERGESDRLGQQDEDQTSDKDDDAFQTMGAHLQPATKKRNVPMLTVYLATASVRELKSAYGEQT